jgi:signal peptidase I
MSPALALAAPHRAAANLSRHTLLNWVAVIAMAALALGVLVFWMIGGRWFVIQTASMGTAAPVGSLVIDQPVAASSLEVGDVITFHPPTAPRQTYTHRIVDVADDGALKTRGDANGTDDGWQLRARDVVGKAVAVLPVVGWLVRAAPILLTGTMLLWQLSRLIRHAAWRSAVRLIGAPLLISGTISWLHPLVNVVLVAAAAQHTGTTLTVMSTGVLPIRILTSEGRSTHLVDGQIGRLLVSTPSADGQYAVSSALDLPIWGWALLLCVTCVPVVAAIVTGSSLDQRSPLKAS